MDNYLRRGLIRNIQMWVPKEKCARDAFFRNMSTNKNVNNETLIEYQNENWCPIRLARNRNFSFEWVDILPNLEWDWVILSSLNPDMKYLLCNLKKPWIWSAVSMSANITFMDMVEHSALPWTINEVMFQVISSDEDLVYLRKFRDRYDFQAWVDHSSRVMWNLVKQSDDLPWVYYNVAAEVDTDEDLEFIRNHDPASWDWIHLSIDADIEVILRNMDLPWNWTLISSKNETVTFRVVMEHPEAPWEYTLVPSEVFDDTLARQWIAASHIKRMFRRAISDPDYALCRKRLMNEWSEGLEIRGSEIVKDVAERCSV